VNEREGYFNVREVLDSIKRWNRTTSHN